MGVYKESVRRLVWLAGGDPHRFGLRYNTHAQTDANTLVLPLLC